MNREVNEHGLKFHKQNELPLLLGLPATARMTGVSCRSAGRQVAVAPDDILSWEICAYDTQPGTFWGADQEFIADSQLDNLASCHAALSALLCAEVRRRHMIALFDHEEVGSESATGAGGSFIADHHAPVAAAGLDAEVYRVPWPVAFSSAPTWPHAWHPNFPAAYEPTHRVRSTAVR